MYGFILGLKIGHLNLISVYPGNKKKRQRHGNFIKKRHFKRALSDQKGHINLAISMVA